MTDSLSCDLSVFISKISECNQVELSAAVLAAFVNFKYFCINWMILAYFSDFNLYSLKICCNALSCSISMYHSSPIYITSPFYLPESDTNCQVLQ